MSWTRKTRNPNCAVCSQHLGIPYHKSGEHKMAKQIYDEQQRQDKQVENMICNCGMHLGIRFHTNAQHVEAVRAQERARREELAAG